jgi:hypothetical protein
MDPATTHKGFAPIRKEGKSSSPWRASATIASTATDLLPVVASVFGGLGPQRVRNHNRRDGGALWSWLEWR